MPLCNIECCLGHQAAAAGSLLGGNASLDCAHDGLGLLVGGGPVLELILELLPARQEENNSKLASNGVDVRVSDSNIGVGSPSTKQHLRLSLARVN